MAVTSTYRLPRLASADGQWVIEGHGVDPDIEVDNDAASVIEAQTTQLERAVQEVMKQMATKRTRCRRVRLIRSSRGADSSRETACHRGDRIMRTALAILISIGATTTAIQQSPDVLEGQPRFDQGDAVYYVWHEGRTWHVRWTAMDRGHDFKGIVAVTGGTLGSLKENDSEKEALQFLASQRRVPVGNDRNDPGLRVAEVPTINRTIIRPDGADKIVFDARTSNSIGGFDFVPDDSTTILQLDLQIDKKSVPGLVRLGKKMKKASEMPVAISLRPAAPSQ